MTKYLFHKTYKFGYLQDVEVILNLTYPPFVLNAFYTTGPWCLNKIVEITFLVLRQNREVQIRGVNVEGCEVWGVVHPQTYGSVNL